MKKILLVLAMAATLSACHDNTPAPQPQGYAFSQPTEQVAPAPQVQAPPTTVVVNQAPAANSGGDGMLTGALLGGAVGYMAGSANRQPAYQPHPAYYAPRPYVDRRPIIVKQTKNVYVQNNTTKVTKVAPAPSVATTPRLSLAKSSSSGSSFGGFSRRSGR